ncbi:MAG: sulfotransferase domain-containing protein [Solirubrobacterales bacterium]
MSARRKKLRGRRKRDAESGGGRARWAEPIEPPECPEGWSTGPPDFVGIGAQRSGTSWWYAGLEANDGVSRPPKRSKELHFFSRFWRGDRPADLAAQYHRQFPRQPGTLAGEWTPRYMHDYWSVPMLAEAAPATRLLVLLRDPIERYRSGLAFAESRAEKAAAPLRLVQVADAVSRSMYFEELRHVARFFPRDQILVLQFERCRQDPLGEMARTCAYLGLEAPAELPVAMERKRRARDKPELAEAARAELVERLSDDVRSLVGEWPQIDLGLWPNFSHLADSTGLKDSV